MSGIRYKSTRGKQSNLTFQEVVLGGLATDKGLYIPQTIPNFTIEKIEEVIYILIKNSIQYLSLHS